MIQWTLSKLEGIPALSARLALGLVFAASGWGKLQHTEKVIEYFRTLGIPRPEFQAPMVAVCELVFGGLLVLGLATRAACLPLAVILVTAIFKAKVGSVHGLAEWLALPEILYLLLMFWLTVHGPGWLSADRWLRRQVR